MGPPRDRAKGSAGLRLRDRERERLRERERVRERRERLRGDAERRLERERERERERLRRGWWFDELDCTGTHDKTERVLTSAALRSSGSQWSLLRLLPDTRGA